MSDNFWWENQAKGKKENTIQSDFFDKWTWDDLMEETPKMDEFLDSSKKRIETVEKLSEDLFYALYKNVPKNEERTQVKMKYWPNYAFVDKMKDMPEYQRLRAYTRLNDFEAMVGTKAFLTKMIEEMSEEESQAMNDTNEAEQAEQQVEDLQKRQEELGQGNSPQHTMNQQALSQAKQNLQSIQKKMIEKMDNVTQSMTARMSSAIQQAKDETEQVQSAMAGWGTGDGAISKMPYQEKMKMAEVLTGKPRVRQLMKHIGRLRRLMATKQAQKLKRVDHEIVDIEQGDDIGRILPSEMVQLATPETEMVFFRKFYEKQLLQYKLEGKNPAGKGPIVCLIDSSGSMSGEPDTWAKGIAVALLDLAMKQKRHFCAIIFSHSEDQMKTIEFAPNEQHVVDKVVEMAEYFIGGGTDFQHPINAGLAVIKSKKAFEKADMIILTDGCCGVSEEWLEAFMAEKKRLKLNLYAVNVGEYPDTLAQMCDKVIKTDQLMNVETTGELFTMV